MSENKKRKLKYLFTQYVRRHITNEELSDLKSIVNSSGNEDLDKPLRELWMNKEYPPFLPTDDQKIRMIQRIEQSIQKENHPIVLSLHKRFFRTFSRIAAVFIFALLSGICIYLYRSNQNLTVYKNNEIMLNVGNGQEAGFILPDGTSVKLNSGSTLCYANNFGENNRFVNFSGEAFFEVKQDKNRPFIVSTKYLNIEVVGTTFNVYAFDSSDVVEMTLLTGSVKASSKKNPEYHVFVKPNEKVVCDISTGKLTVQKTDTQYETAWLNGEIVFKSETLSNVLAKLERKYGVHIRYEGNADLLNDRFSGRIGKDNNMDDVLKILTNHYPLKYGQKGNAFILSNRKQK
ncbi:MAG: FecR domain-containing protein [Dysgonamonadaceae bacterium]|jgi:ferric-dicitrate binding protein FerR (iron transport regulator)|nr:FecR domain-containing protein [Dysgonamonadaceae bacterium]